VTKEGREKTAKKVSAEALVGEAHDHSSAA